MYITRRVKQILIALVVVVIIAVVVTLAVTLTGKNDDLTITKHDAVTFKQAALTSNGKECAGIGRDTLMKGGSVADAAIAALFCEGVTCAQSMGLGGGFLLTIYIRAEDRVLVLDSRERAPAAAHKDMFQGGAISSTVGGMAVAVPGELRGYETLHKRFGQLPWAELVQPTIDLCRSGYIVTDYFARVLRNNAEQIAKEPSFVADFINPETNAVWVEGDTIKRLKLADTLEIIAREGVDALYNGSLTENFLADIHERNGTITRQDLLDYQPTWRQPVTADLGNNMTMHTVPLPGSGHLLAFILNTLRGWAVDSSSVLQNSLVYWQRIIEVFKYCFAKRTGLGDTDYLDKDKIQPLVNNLTSLDYAEYIRSLVSDNTTSNDFIDYGTEFDILEDHGTAHLCIIAPNGDAISVTSTVNYILGAFFASPSTGIILNNEMDDFSYPNISNVYGIPPSPTNYPVPGKRPLSSMVPSIVLEDGKGVKFIVGAAGGTKITTQVAMIIINHLINDLPLDTALDVPRLHHQLMPMRVQYETGFNETILEGLKRIGHELSELSPTAGFAAVTAITVDQLTGDMTPQFDKRRPGSIAGY